MLAMPWFDGGAIDMQELLRRLAEQVVNAVMDAEADQLCGGGANSRNGYREHSPATCVGTLTLCIPKLRSSSFFPEGVRAPLARRPRPRGHRGRDARHRHECLYGYTRLPIYCMYTVRENDIVDSSVQIPKRMIREYGCADGWIGIVQYDSFARLADTQIADDGNIHAHGPISYGVPGPKLIREIFEGIPHNLVIKTPRYVYQKEYRIIGS